MLNSFFAGSDCVLRGHYCRPSEHFGQEPDRETTTATADAIAKVAAPLAPPGSPERPEGRQRDR